MFLAKSSWHHTSSYYNKTDFYSIDEDALVRYKDEVLEIVSKPKEKAVKDKEAPQDVYRKCHYLTWEGSRKHPKPVHHEEVCKIVGNWAITTNGKKSITANGFEFLD